MKKILILAGILLATMTSYAQNIQQGGEGTSLHLEKNGKKIVNETFEKVAVYNSKANLIPAKLKGKWGFYDNDGKLVIPHQYVGLFFEYPYAWYTGGLIQVNFNGNKILIDKTGNEVKSTIDYLNNLGVEGENRYFAARDKDGNFALANEEKILTAFEYLALQLSSKNPITFNAVRKSDNKLVKLNNLGEDEGAVKIYSYVCDFCGKKQSSNVEPSNSGCKVRPYHKWVKQ